MPRDESKTDKDETTEQWIKRRLAAAEARTPLLEQWVDTGVKPEDLK